MIGRTACVVVCFILVGIAILILLKISTDLTIIVYQLGG